MIRVFMVECSYQPISKEFSALRRGLPPPTKQVINRCSIVRYSSFKHNFSRGKGRRLSAANAVSSVSKPRPFNKVASIQFLLRKNHSATTKQVPECCAEGAVYRRHRYFKSVASIQFCYAKITQRPTLRQGWERLCGEGNAVVFSARRRRPTEAPRTGGRGRAARATAQKTGICRAAFERTARSRHRASDVREAPKNKKTGPKGRLL